ncbi:NAD(P)-dependent malic enzyme [Tautonia rosea]|uniref:NAD(P)-dependent malic enzyme n=1 Tax=Tautonia rosea TaxID=2728037 RepID=UPI001473B87D|nr:NADP-dependent malic enzyme [Tautonia rosea]
MAEVKRRTDDPRSEAVRLHARHRGTVQMMPKCPIRGFGDFAIWYTPGVAASCLAIASDPDRVFEQTNRGNTVAIVSDGSRVLGLGNIGPAAGLPVMEGKALLFKYLGGVDAVPLCLSVADADTLIEVVRALEPSFGGINLEDIAQPKCFRILDTLRDAMDIPVWHDDQQGTATALLAGLTNALEVVGKPVAGLKVAMIGMGAANVATYRLLTAWGLDPSGVIACDSTGILHPGRSDIEARCSEFVDKWRICRESNAEGVVGGIAEAMRGADVCIAFAAPGPEVIRPEWVQSMAHDAVVFACANPVPEIWPDEAKRAGARVVATGRSDFPNQVNNSLVFPGLFRGVLDVRARCISNEMAIAAAETLARCGQSRGLSPGAIVPRMDDPELAPKIAAAVAAVAVEQGLARNPIAAEQVERQATERIRRTRAAAEMITSDRVLSEPIGTDPDEPDGASS